MRTAFRAFLLAALLELASLLGYLAPPLEPAFLAFAAIAALFLGFRDLRLLLAFAVLEAVIGGHGWMFDAAFAGSPLSIRMILFALLLAGWLVHVARGCSRLLHFAHANVTAPLLVLLAAVALAAVRGLSLGAAPGEVFADMNGYLYVLLVPVAIDLLADRASFAWIASVFAGGVAWLSAKSILLFYLFSHDFGPFLDDIFSWQRRSWLSEITRYEGGVPRVFSSSDVFLLLAIPVGILLLRKIRTRGLRLWTALACAAFLLSFSRSFWLGGLVALAFMLPVLARTGTVPFGGWKGFFRDGLAAVFLGLAGLVLLALLPFPRPSAGGAAWNALNERFAAGDAAVTSRWKMLDPLYEGIARSPVLGSGFGATVTYRSDDPRIRSLHPGGVLTTGAVEWQYLEIWLKMGLLGLAAVVWLWWRIGRFCWKSLEQARGADQLVAAGLMLGFLAFVLANVFTPYVNHPLGWTFLTLVLAGLHAVQEHVPPSHDRSPRPI